MLRNGKRVAAYARPRRGFTLVELLVVIAIIGILVALLLPAVQAAREAARRTQCANNIRQVGLAFHNYHTTHNVMPPGMLVWIRGHTGNSCGPTPDNPSYYAGFGWSTFLLPYLEQQAVYDLIDFKQAGRSRFSFFPYDAPQNTDTLDATTTFIAAFLCPSDPQGRELVNITGHNGDDPKDIARTNLAGVSDSRDWTCDSIWPYQTDRADGALGERISLTVAQFSDGLSNTLLVGEVTGGGSGSHASHFWASWNLADTADGINGPFTVLGGEWPGWKYSYGSSSADAGFRDTGFSSYHPGGCHFLFGDGSVHYLSESISSGARPVGDPPSVLQALTTRAGAEVIPGDAF